MKNNHLNTFTHCSKHNNARNITRVSKAINFTIQRSSKFEKIVAIVLIESKSKKRRMKPSYNHSIETTKRFDEPNYTKNFVIFDPPKFPGKIFGQTELIKISNFFQF